MLVQLKWLLKWMAVSCVMSMIFSLTVFASTQNNQSIVGYWQTIDGKTKKPSSVIAIQAKNGFYEGKIFKTYVMPNTPGVSRCVACRDDRKNKPILGLTIIRHMVCKPGYCSHGTILDPRNGKIYHATMRLINQGRQLKVRGYIGVPLFGKSVTWNRVSVKSAQ